MNSLLINLVQGCNLWELGGCKYCFFRTERFPQFKLMPYDIFEEVLNQWIKSKNYQTGLVLKLYLHGGEICLANMSYLTKILDIQKKYEKRYDMKIKNYIQSNATLINKIWAEFFSMNNFRIGISLEALPELHDKLRCDSFQKTLEGIRELQSVDIYPSVISVLNKTSLSYLLENDNLERHFDFYMNNKIYSWAYNNYVSPDGQDREIVSDEDYLTFVGKTLKLWLRLPKSPVIKIREIDNFLTIADKRFNIGCSFSQICHRYISIDPNGDIFPCERLMGTRFYHKLGNIKDGLKDIINHRVINSDKILSVECTNCEIKKGCNGGCTAMRKDDKYIYCNVVKTIVGSLEEVIKYDRAA